MCPFIISCVYIIALMNRTTKKKTKCKKVFIWNIITFTIFITSDKLQGSLLADVAPIVITFLMSMFFLGRRGKSSEWRIPSTVETWVEDSVRLVLTKNPAFGLESHLGPVRHECLYRIAIRIIDTHKSYLDDNVGTQSAGC